MTDMREHCNLSDEDHEARWKEVRQKLLPQARGREALADGVVLLFDATPALREELDAFVAFERECCPGLRWFVQDAAEALRLEIRGVDPHAAIFAGVGQPNEPDTLTSAGAPPPVRRGWKQILHSAGLGTVGALVLFCAVPLGAAGVFGVTMLSGLDNPWAIGSGAVVFGGLAWLWERRRNTARAKPGSAGDCGC